MFITTKVQLYHEQQAFQKYESGSIRKKNIRNALMVWLVFQQVCFKGIGTCKTKIYKEILENRFCYSVNILFWGLESKCKLLSIEIKVTKCKVKKPLKNNKTFENNEDCAVMSKWFQIQNLLLLEIHLFCI